MVHDEIKIEDWSNTKILTKAYYLICMYCDGKYHPKCLPQTLSVGEAKKIAEEWICDACQPIVDLG